MPQLFRCTKQFTTLTWTAPDMDPRSIYPDDTIGSKKKGPVGSYVARRVGVNGEPKQGHQPEIWQVAVGDSVGSVRGHGCVSG